jgi:hypothetical protein
MEASGLEDRSLGEPELSRKDILWRLTAVIVVLALAVIFIMIGMKLAWIGG